MAYVKLIVRSLRNSGVRFSSYGQLLKPITLKLLSHKLAFKWKIEYREKAFFSSKNYAISSFT